MKKKTLSVLSLVATGGILLSGCGTTQETKNDQPLTTTPASKSEDKSKSPENIPTPSTPPPPPTESETFNDADGIPLPPKSVPTDQNSQDEISVSAGYKDGTYSSFGSYISPAGQENIEVEIALENNIITGVSVVPQADNETSQKMQTLFAQGIPSVVVGKKIGDVKDIAAVNGSSLAGKGFLDALGKIKDEAML